MLERASSGSCDSTTTRVRRSRTLADATPRLSPRAVMRMVASLEAGDHRSAPEFVTCGGAVRAAAPERSGRVASGDEAAGADTSTSATVAAAPAIAVLEMVFVRVFMATPRDRWSKTTVPDAAQEEVKFSPRT